MVWANFGSPFFFFFFLPALPLLDIKAIVYNNKQSLYVISRKSNEMTKNLVSGPILAPLAQNWALKKFSWTFPQLNVRHYCKVSWYSISRRANEPELTWENERKSSFGHDFGRFWPKFSPLKFFLLFLPLLDIMYCCKLSWCAISRKTNGQNLRKWKKT